MAFKPNGVAALPSPKALAAMFITMAPMAVPGVIGWHGREKPNQQRRISRAKKLSPPASSTTFTRPRNRAM